MNVKAVVERMLQEERTALLQASARHPHQEVTAGQHPPGQAPSPLSPEMRLVEDLGFDSLSMIELLLQAEDAFDIDIPDEDVGNIVTVQDCITYIESRVK